MAVTNIQILTWIGITVAQQRNAIIADLLSDGLGGLEHMTHDDVKETCSSYAKRTDGPFPIILTPLTKQRIHSLVLRVQDMIRAEQTPTFPDTTDRTSFIELLDASLVRDRNRKSQKKVGESYHNVEFNTKLKSQGHYEKFEEELQSTLENIVGSKGVPLTYILRKEETPVYDPDIPYEENIIDAVALTGESFKNDARLVHQIILRNASEESNAYTHIKPLLRYRDGRKDIMALKERYSSDASKQATINNAKQVLDTLRYKNERSFTFEKFSSKLQKAYDELNDSGREVNNGDIVDGLWERIQSQDIQVHVASLKVNYQQNPRNYKLILQDVASEISTSRKVTFAEGSSNRSVSGVHTFKGQCPSNGVHTSDGSIFIGSYDSDKWNSESVRPYHKEIREKRAESKAQNNNSDFNSRGNKRNVNALKRNKRTLKALNVKIASAKLLLKTHQADGDDNDDSTAEDAGAGNAFGGSSEKTNKKKRS